VGRLQTPSLLAFVAPSPELDGHPTRAAGRARVSPPTLPRSPPDGPHPLFFGFGALDFVIAGPYAPPPPLSSFQAPCASPPSHALPAPCPPRCTLRFALLSDDNPRGPPASYFFVSVALSLSPLPSPSVSVPCQVCVVHPSHANPCLSVDPMVCYTGVALSCRRATCPGPSRRGAHALPATVSAVRTGRTIGSHLNPNLTYLTQPCGRGPLPVAQAAFPTVGAYCQPRASPPARPPTPNTHRAPFPGGPAPHMRPLGLASHVGARPPLSAHRASIPFHPALPSEDWYPTPAI
jgi:hypothetical protein